MKKTNIVIGLILLTALISSSIYNSQSFDNRETLQGRGPAINLYLDANVTPPSENIDKLPIYKIVPDFTLTEFKDIANAFGLHGGINSYLDEQDNLRAYKVGNDNGLMEYWMKTGVLTYTSSNAFPTVSEQPKLPSDEEAIDIATDFLKENGFWNDDMKYYNISYDYQRLCRKSTGEVIQEFVLTKWVYFGEKIDGLPITGAAGKIVVAIGKDNNIVKFIVPQRAFEKIEEKQLLPIQDVLSNLKNGRGALSIPRAPLAGRNITITNAHLTYYAGSIPEGNDGGLLIPSYYLEGEFEDTGQGIGFYTKAI